MGLFGDFVETAGDAAGAVGDLLEDAVDGAVDFVEDAIDSVADVVDDAIDAVGDIADDIVNAVRDMGDDLLDAADDVFDAIGDMAEAALDGVTDFAEGAVEALADLAEQAWEEISAGVDAAWDAMAAAAEDAWESVSSAAEDAWERIAAAAESAWEHTVDAVEFVYEKAAQAYERALDVVERTLLWLGDLIKDIAYAIAMLGPCLAGILIHDLAEADNVLLNLGKGVRTLPAAFRAEARALFPDIPFDKVFFMENASLSGNHFSDGTEAMTFMQTEVAGINLGYMIWMRDSFDPTSNKSKVLMIHELMHVEQYRQFRFEDAFACAYGIGFASAGFDYKKNPLEDQAFEVDDQYELSLTP